MDKSDRKKELELEIERWQAIMNEQFLLVVENKDAAHEYDTRADWKQYALTLELFVTAFTSYFTATFELGDLEKGIIRPRGQRESE